MIGKHMSSLDIRGREFLRAITQLQRRADRELDADRLMQVLVESDLSIRAENSDTQLVLGRRGTGKTHLMKAFAQRQRESGEVAIYVDCTKLGSGLGVGADAIVTARKYFAALLNEVLNFLFDQAVILENPPPSVQERAEKSIYALVPYTHPTTTEGEPTFNYRQITESLTNILALLDINRFYVILDEWVSISPIDAQPHVAEFIKRCFLPIPQFSLKILAVSYLSQFRTTYLNNPIGIERAADITDTIDIDSYLIYEEKADFMQRFFAEVLYNHLATGLDWNINESRDTKFQKILSLFTQERTLIELVVAAEGNCRDFLSIFCESVHRFRRDSGAQRIGIPHVRTAAAHYYQTEKEGNIRAEEEANKALDFLLNQVLKGYKARSFMVQVGQEEHPHLVTLLYNRVIHKLNRYYSHPDRSTARYSLYSLDYGAYAQFQRTIGGSTPILEEIDPTIEGTEKEIEKYAIGDDGRSYRRIIFDPEKLTISEDSQEVE
jgi:energy-coupling factor transporter ATP-binding protein EcfA2